MEDLQSVLDAGRALGSSIEADKPNEVVVIPADYRVEALEKLVAPFAKAPRRLTAKLSFSTLDSFIAYVTLFKCDATQIFIRQASAVSVVAILDYHNSETFEASWCEHRATYAPEMTPEWQRWISGHKRQMTQTELATFLEENQQLIMTPPGAELLELVQTLEGKNDIKCNSTIRLTNGRTKLIYEEDVVLRGSTSTQKGEIEFPSQLVAALPLFTGGPTYKVTCRLKYRINSAKLVFWYEMVDTHLILQDAIRGIEDRIQEKLAIAPLMGELL